MKDKESVEATFTYSVQWRESDTPYEKRMDKYRRYQFLPQHLEVARPICATASVDAIYHRATALCLDARAAGGSRDSPGLVLQHAETPAPLSPSLQFRDAWLVIYSAMHGLVKQCRHAVRE